MIYRKFLFYYSLFISSVLFVWIILFFPRPESLIPLALFLPIVIHFWLGIIWPSKISELASRGTQDADIMKGQLFSFSLTVMISIIVATLSILIYAFAYERYSPIVNSLQSKKPEEKELLLILSKVKSLDENSQELNRKLDRISDEVLGSTSGDEYDINKERIQEIIENSDSSSTQSGVLKAITKANVYDDTNPKSKINGTTSTNQIYNFSQKVGQWYLITLPDFTEGWIEKNNIIEL